MAKKKPGAGTTKPRKGDSGSATAEAPAPVSVKSFATHVAATLMRSQILLAEYNPRVQSPHARKKLKGIIKQVGLVEPVVVNRRLAANGFDPDEAEVFMLVGGHQRIGAMDELVGYRPGDDAGDGNPPAPVNDYEVPAAVIEVDLPTEKAINVALNNPGIQGGWDPALLESLLSDPSIDLAVTGFEKVDLHMLLTDEGMASIFPEQAEAEADSVATINQMKADSLEAGRDERAAAKSGQSAPADNRVEGSSVPQNVVPTKFTSPAVASARAGASTPEEFSAALAEVRKKPVSERTTEDWKLLRQEYQDKQVTDNDSEFYVVLIFEDQEQVTRFLDLAGLDTGHRYHPGQAVADLCGIQLSAEPLADDPTDDPIDEELAE